MSLLCVNSGGPSSLLRLPQRPVLEQEVQLAADTRSALDAWQARPGDILTVVDPQQDCYRARFTRIDDEQIVCVPFARCRMPAESALNIHVYHALPEKERFELVLEKLTEIGVSRIVPVETSCSVTLAERDAAQKKSHRWPHLVCRAARQCRRAMLPELCAPVDFAGALEAATQAELKFLLYEGETHWSLSEGANGLRPSSVALLIGPEGGFAEAEVRLAQDHGVLPIHLGPRILRTETAAIVGAALVQGLLGDMC